MYSKELREGWRKKISPFELYVPNAGKREDHEKSKGIYAVAGSTWHSLMYNMTGCMFCTRYVMSVCG